MTAGGAVTFNCGSAPVTIAVTSAINVTKATVVDGAALVTLDGGGTNQIFLVASNNSLSVRNLRFVNGKSPSATDATGIGGAVSGNWRSKVEVIGCTFENNTAARGGGAVAVWTGSSLTIVGSRFTGNVSWYGGAVYSLLSPLQVINSELTNNSTILQSGYGDGGAIGTDGASESTSDTIGGTIQICGTKITNNQGNGSGGGAYLWMYPPDQAIIDRTTVESNSVVKNASGSGSIGGAMRISNGAVTITASSFLSNTSIGNGAGLYLDCSPACTITNSTFYANKNTAGWGGAIFSGTSSGAITMDNVTFANNAQQGTSGNATFGSATWTINNSIFFDNSCANSGTGAHVLQWNSTSKSAGSGPCISGVTAGDPKLSAPADNGGPTYTMLPGTASAALQMGANCEATDQRGQTRNTASCDVGSVEVP
jgi:predicted outer membrane repeat protein